MPEEKLKQILVYIVNYLAHIWETADIFNKVSKKNYHPFISSFMFNSNRVLRKYRQIRWRWDDIYIFDDNIFQYHANSFLKFHWISFEVSASFSIAMETPIRLRQFLTNLPVWDARKIHKIQA